MTVAQSGTRGTSHVFRSVKRDYKVHASFADSNHSFVVPAPNHHKSSSCADHGAPRNISQGDPDFGAHQSSRRSPPDNMLCFLICSGKLLMRRPCRSAVAISFKRRKPNYALASGVDDAVPVPAAREIPVFFGRDACDGVGSKSHPSCLLKRAGTRPQ